MDRLPGKYTGGPLPCRVRRIEMKNNEYDAAEVVEIGAAQAVVLGEKTPEPDLDSSLMEPLEKHYQE